MHAAIARSSLSSARRALLACALSALLSACGDDDGATNDAGTLPDASLDAGALDAGAMDAGPPPEPRVDYGVRGAFPVGNRRVVMDDGTGSRALPVELWYPAAESARTASEAGVPLAAFESGRPHDARMMELVAASDPACLRAQTAAAPDVAAATRTAPWPLVVFSHCHVCTRFDVAEVAERLASHGIVVAAPDHEGNTLWDFEAGMAADVGSAFLAVRVRDVRRVLDRLLDAGATEIPEDLRGHFDAAHAGVMGHSFGGVTTGAVVAEEPRFIAALSIAAPISLISGTRPASVTTPYLLLLAREDNSITEAGNMVMRNDFRRLGGPAWLVEVDDAGHWSFSDIAGLGGTNFLAGCGAGTRQTVADETFRYLENGTARDLAADVATAFFAVYLLDDPGGATTLARLPVPAHVSNR